MRYGEHLRQGAGGSWRDERTWLTYFQPLRPPFKLLYWLLPPPPGDAGEREPKCVTSKRTPASWTVLLSRPFWERAGGEGPGPGPRSKHELVMRQPRLLHRQTGGGKGSSRCGRWWSSWGCLNGDGCDFWETPHPNPLPPPGEREPQCITSKRATANWPVLLPRPFGERAGVRGLGLGANMNLSCVNPVFLIAKRVAGRGRAGAGDGGGRRVALMEMGVIFGRPLTPTLSPRRGRGAEMRYFEAGHSDLACIAPSPLRGEGWGEGPGGL